MNKIPEEHFPNLILHNQLLNQAEREEGIFTSSWMKAPKYETKVMVGDSTQDGEDGTTFCPSGVTSKAAGFPRSWKILENPEI